MRSESPTRLRGSFENSAKSIEKEFGGCFTRFEQSPNSYKALSGQLTETHSARVGGLRIIYAIDENEKLIVLFSVGHRESVYES